MPCTTADGKPTPTARQVLASLQGGGLAVDAIASAAGLPLFRVRSSMRELLSAGWVREAAEGRYELSDPGRDILKTP